MKQILQYIALRWFMWERSREMQWHDPAIDISDECQCSSCTPKTRDVTMDYLKSLLKRVFIGREPDEIIRDHLREAERELLICHAEMEYCKFRAAMLKERLTRLKNNPYGVVNEDGN